jgi:hypothetical protein
MEKLNVRIHFAHYVNSRPGDPQHAIEFTDLTSGLMLASIPMTDAEVGRFLSNSDFELSNPIEFNTSANVGKQHQIAHVLVPDLDYGNWDLARAATLVAMNDADFKPADGWQPRNYDLRSFNGHMQSPAGYRIVIERWVEPGTPDTPAMIAQREALAARPPRRRNTGRRPVATPATPVDKETS